MSKRLQPVESLAAMDHDYSAESFWDREVVAPKHYAWMELPAVRDYILRSISGEERGLWPTDWLLRWLNGRVFDRALSIGCGTGALERDLIRKNIAGSIDAFDGSTNSLRMARAEAARQGMASRIRYYAADFNEPALPRSVYDAVFIHQAAHHVGKLEKLFRAILRCLKPDGILYLDEFVGPSRHYWTAETLQPYEELFLTFPLQSRRYPGLPLPVMYDDPSEATRSDEILPQLRIGFEIRETRGYGGNLFSIIGPCIDLESVPGGIDRLIAEEQRRIRRGEQSFYALAVATPRTGLRRLVAEARYVVEPKVKRAIRELRAIRQRKR